MIDARLLNDAELATAAGAGEGHRSKIEHFLDPRVHQRHGAHYTGLVSREQRQGRQQI